MVFKSVYTCNFIVSVIFDLLSPMEEIGKHQNTLDGYGKKDDKSQPHYKVNHLWKVKTKLCGTKRIALSTKNTYLLPTEQWTIFQNVVSGRLILEQLISKYFLIAKLIF